MKFWPSTQNLIWNIFLIKKEHYCCSHQFDKTTTKVVRFGKYRYIGITKKISQWCHRGCHMTWLQFADQTQNEDWIWYLKFYLHKWLQTLLGMLGWKKNFINDVIVTGIWPGYNLQTRHKMRSIFDISSYTSFWYC